MQICSIAISNIYICDSQEMQQTQTQHSNAVKKFICMNATV